jgi:hypothetical protein
VNPLYNVLVLEHCKSAFFFLFCPRKSSVLFSFSETSHLSVLAIFRAFGFGSVTEQASTVPLHRTATVLQRSAARTPSNGQEGNPTSRYRAYITSTALWAAKPYYPRLSSVAPPPSPPRRGRAVVWGQSQGPSPSLDVFTLLVPGSACVVLFFPSSRTPIERVSGSQLVCSSLVEPWC